MLEHPHGSNHFTTQHISFLCPLNILFPSLSLHQSKQQGSVTCSSKVDFWGPHSTQLLIAIHQTTPTTLPDKRWQNRRNSRSTVYKEASQTDSQHSWLCWRELLSDLWTRHPNHQSVQPLRYSRYLGHHENEGPSLPGASDMVLCNKLRPPPSNHWQCVSLILSAPTGSPWFQVHWLGQLPDPPGSQNSFQLGIAYRDGHRHIVQYFPPPNSYYGMSQQQQ
jgi:hypothetical protein